MNNKICNNSVNLLFFINDPLIANTGVTKKIKSQIEAFDNICDSVFVCNLSVDNRKRFFSGEVVSGNKLLSKIPYFLRYDFSGIDEKIIAHKINVVYIRYTHFSSPAFIRFLRRLQKFGIHIIMEFPTFPYDEEYKTLPFKSNIKLLIDKCFRMKMAEYTKLAVCFTKNDSIFGIPAFTISNGIGIERMNYMSSKLKRTYRAVNTDVDFIAVSSLEKWHGYDRFISGIYEYIKREPSKNIHFHIVGEGREVNNLVRLVDKLGVEPYVTFHGHCTGEKLDELLLKADIGVDSLARHRVNNFENNSLKSKEYLTFGLPIVKSHRDHSIDSCEYFINVPSDESHIEIDDILNWYYVSNFKKRKDEINQFAKENFSWEKQMQKLLMTVLP